MISAHRYIAGCLSAILASVAIWSLQKTNQADAQVDADPGKLVRCSTRLSISFLGSSPSSQLLKSPDPQSEVEKLLTNPDFHERFARFINSQMNDQPGATPEEDAAYHLSKYILANNLPWKDLFVGPFDVRPANQGRIRIVDDADGLGFFRSAAWLRRYAGNELEGLKISTIYRMMNNALGLKLTATTNAPGADLSATGRAAPACRSCHFDNWYALDKNAALLSTVRRRGNDITFRPPDGEPKEVLGGLMLRDDKDFVTAMVNSEQFSFNVCRVVFRFLYGRDENSCEAEVFDKCVDAFKDSGMIQSSLSTVAKDPSFCQ